VSDYQAFLKLKAEAKCRLCDVAGGPRPNAPFPYEGDDRQHIILTKHHLVPKRNFHPGDNSFRDDPRNTVPLCRRCHNEVEHSHAVRSGVVRARLRAKLRDEEVAFVAQLMGAPWFDREYPESEESVLRA
jgi:hypothetical protein